MSYYVGSSAGAPLAVDIAISSGDIVTIDELPDDPQELTQFLSGEKCQVKYWILIAQAYAQAGQTQHGLVIAKSGLDMEYFSEADLQALHVLVGWITLRLGGEKCAALAGDSFAKGGDSIGAQLGMAQVHTATDHADLALQIYDRLLKDNQNNTYAILGKAQITLSKTANYSNALKLYQQVLVLNPALKPDPRIGVGLCFWFLKDRPMALAAWRRAAELDPSNHKPQVLLNLASFDEVFSNSLSDELFLEGYSKSLNDLTQLQSKNPDDPVLLLALCSFYYSKGNYEMVERIVAKVHASMHGAGDGALATSDKASVFTAKMASNCSFWLGRVSFAKDDFTQAQKHFHDAIRSNEHNLLAKLGLAQSQLGRNSVEEATMTFESILKTNPKCLEVNYSLGLLYLQSTSRTKQEQAIHVLERYIRLSNNRGSAVANKTEADAYLNKEPIALNAFLTLSKLYEPRDLTQALNYLQKAIESRQQVGQDAPLEVYNNVAVLNFIRYNHDDAIKYLELGLGRLAQVPDDQLKSDLQVSITYNLARAKEPFNPQEAISLYEQLLAECPNYFSAKMRLLFLDAVVTKKSTNQELEHEVKALLETHASNLEIRSFYGWFIKNFGRKFGLKPDADATHQKQTLVEYDSHDCYALISLANVYCVMAKDVKEDKEKKKKYFVRAMELYTKVLSIDPKNVFAAQGFAIVYIENKDYTQGLDILRKIRDSLNDISVYLNLGHVLTELKQFSKAIENYEIASSRYADDNDPKLLGFIARAWYQRGTAEKHLPFLKKALEVSEEAMSKCKGDKSSYVFNIAFMQFQIAEFITKQPVEDRTVAEINEAILNLNTAILHLNLLTSDSCKHPPYPKEDIKARADIGASTLLKRLNACLDETKENILEMNDRLEEAKRLRQQEEERRTRELESLMAEQKSKQETLALERAKLQEQAQQWAEESRANLIVNDSEDEKDPEQKKGRKAKKKAKKDFINDTDDEDAADFDHKSDTENEAAVSPKRPAKKGKRRRRVIENEDDDNAADSARKKKAPKSEAMVEASSSDSEALF